jgi:hypothetical protein
LSVLIIGAAARRPDDRGSIQERKMSSYLSSKKSPQSSGGGRLVIGDAAISAPCRRHGLKKPPRLLLTTHDDATNIYLTKYLRSLKAGYADSQPGQHGAQMCPPSPRRRRFREYYASLGATAVFNSSERKIR